jgi:hypothetical protein
MSINVVADVMGVVVHSLSSFASSASSFPSARIPYSSTFGPTRDAACLDPPYVESPVSEPRGLAVALIREVQTTQANITTGRDNSISDINVIITTMSFLPPFASTRPTFVIYLLRLGPFVHFA